jgi:hypothetical protein
LASAFLFAFFSHVEIAACEENFHTFRRTPRRPAPFSGGRPFSSQDFLVKYKWIPHFFSGGLQSVPIRNSFPPGFSRNSEFSRNIVELF